VFFAGYSYVINCLFFIPQRAAERFLKAKKVSRRAAERFFNVETPVDIPKHLRRITGASGRRKSLPANRKSRRKPAVASAPAAVRRREKGFFAPFFIHISVYIEIFR
jgi:hypothetical protein